MCMYNKIYTARTTCGTMKKLKFQRTIQRKKLGITLRDYKTKHLDKRKS